MGDKDLSDPIHSSRAEEPGIGEAIDAFVVTLAERIDSLQDHEARRELDRVASLSRELGSEAERLGFAPLSDCARILASAGGGEDAEAAHKALVDLTGIAQRVRLGHRGSL